MLAFVSSDGEQIQVETFMEQDMVELLDFAGILEAKHSASYSAKGNAWDASNYFKGSKKRLNHLVQHQQEVEITTSSLGRILDIRLTESSSHLGGPMRDKMVNAICKIVTACQKTCNVDRYDQTWFRKNWSVQYGPRRLRF